MFITSFDLQISGIYYGENYGYSVLKKWFPYAKTTYFLLRTYEEHVKCFLEERVCDGEIIDRAQRDALAEDLNALAYRYDKKGFKNLGAYIKAYGYAIEEPVGMRKGDHYIIRKTGENFTDL